MAIYAGRYSEDLQDRYGNGYRNAKVAVQTLLGAAVTLYATRTKTAYVPVAGLAANEIKADNKGNLRFFADPGNYQIVVTPVGGPILAAFPVSVLPDPLEPDASEGALQAEEDARIAADNALSTSVAGKVSKAANGSDFVDVAEVRDNLGLGTAATQSVGAFDPSGAAAAVGALRPLFDQPATGITLKGSVVSVEDAPYTSGLRDVQFWSDRIAITCNLAGNGGYTEPYVSVWDVSGDVPLRLGSVTSTSGQFSLAGVYALQLHPSLPIAYAVSPNTGRLVVVDFSDPTSPQLVSDVRGYETTALQNLRRGKIWGRWLVHGTSGDITDEPPAPRIGFLVVFDLLDPLRPTLAFAATGEDLWTAGGFAGTYPELMGDMHEVDVNEDGILVSASPGSHSIELVDLNPLNEGGDPVLLGWLQDDTVLTEVLSVSYRRNLIYYAAPGAYSDTGRVGVVSALRPDAPVIVGELAHADFPTVRSVRAWGDRVSCLSASGTHNLFVLDVTDPTIPIVETSVAIAGSNRREHAIQNGRVLVAQASGNVAGGLHHLQIEGSVDLPTLRLGQAHIGDLTGETLKVKGRATLGETTVRDLDTGSLTVSDQALLVSAEADQMVVSQAFRPPEFDPSEFVPTITELPNLSLFYLLTQPAGSTTIDDLGPNNLDPTTIAGVTFGVDGMLPDGSTAARYGNSGVVRTIVPTHASIRPGLGDMSYVFVLRRHGPDGTAEGWWRQTNPTDVGGGVRISLTSAGLVRVEVNNLGSGLNLEVTNPLTDYAYHVVIVVLDRDGDLVINCDREELGRLAAAPVVATDLNVAGNPLLGALTTAGTSSWFNSDLQAFAIVQRALTDAEIVDINSAAFGGFALYNQRQIRTLIADGTGAVTSVDGLDGAVDLSSHYWSRNHLVAVARTANGTPINNSTVGVADSVLRVLAAKAVGGSIWRVQWDIYVSSPTTADSRVKVVAAGATGSVTVSGLASTATATTTAPLRVPQTVNGSTVVNGGLGAGALSPMVITALVVMGGSAADITLELSQGTAELSDTYMAAGSSMFAQRIA